MTRRRRAALLLAVIVLGAAGCAEASGGADPEAPAADLLGAWELAEATSAGAALPAPTGSRATLVFEAGRIGGTSFCNSYGADYRLAGSELRIGAIGGTEMGCAPDVMTAERAYLTALQGSDTATVEHGDLVLTGDGVNLRFSRRQPVPASELVGTRWVLDTLVDGEIASSTVGEPAVLVLVADGRLSGSTGCRPLSGRWAVTGDTLVLSPLHVDGACPAEVSQQDTHVTAVLEESRPVVDGDRLTLTGPGGLGLVYRDGSG